MFNGKEVSEEIRRGGAVLEETGNREEEFRRA